MDSGFRIFTLCEEEGEIDLSIPTNIFSGVLVEYDCRVSVVQVVLNRIVVEID